MAIAHVKCPLCALDDHHARTRHHFDLMEQGLDDFRQHLEDAYATHPGATQHLPHLLQWAAGLIKSYSGMADPETGRPLPWREAMRAFHVEVQARSRRRVHDAHPPAAGPGLAALGPVVRSILLPPGPTAWGKCWMLLCQQGFTRPGREGELAKACRLLADDYPEDRDDWLRHAARLEREASALEVCHGEEVSV